MNAAEPGTTPAADHLRAPRPESPSGGFLIDVTAIFAGILLLVNGAFGILQGAAAIADDDLYSAGSEFLYKFDMTVWGWTHVVLGVLCIIVAIGILREASWALVSGMVIAGLSALANFAFLPHYPWWALTVIVVDLLIIHALSTQLRRA